MPLIDVELPLRGIELPEHVTAFLDVATRRVDRHIDASPVSVAGFVPSDSTTVYRGLSAIYDGNLATGRMLCEWGSGFGVIASLAAMLGFRASGIEIQPELCDAARQLARDFDLAVDFVHGSFVPLAGQVETEEALAASQGEFLWLVTDADDAYDQLELEPDDFDVVFAYPWPGEEHLITSIFERHAAPGALLLTYNQYDSLRLQRKISRLE